MRIWVFNLLIASMLFMSLEGAAESIDEQSFHQAHHFQSGDSGDQWLPNSDGNGHDGDSCEHFCHAHIVALTTRVSLPNLPKFRQYAPSFLTPAISCGAAPPTPPPNI